VRTPSPRAGKGLRPRQIRQTRQIRQDRQTRQDVPDGHRTALGSACMIGLGRVNLKICASTGDRRIQRCA
jgi:hypothetical protein